jgi:hypothetical protein
MDDHHGLRTLQVRVTGDNDLDVSRASADERSLQVFEAPVNLRSRATHEQLEIRRHLVIAAARRMQLAPYIARAGNERLLDVHVDVFELGPKRERSRLNFARNLVERRDDHLALVAGQQANLRKHLRMGFGAANIDPGQPAIKANRLSKPLDSRVCRLLESTPPSFG